MSKRINGEGSIRKRGNGYQGRITIGEGDEQRTVTFTRPTAEEASAELRAIKARVDEGKPPTDSSMPLRDWITAWIAGSLSASERRQATKDQYALLLKKHISPKLGGTKLSAVRPSAIEKVLADLRANRSASTTRSTYAALSACMATAVRDGLIARNPVEAVDRPAAERREPRSPSKAEVQALITGSAGSRIQHLIALLAATGLRRGEALGLRWIDVNLDDKQLTVRGQLVRTSEGLRRSDPKSRSGFRTFSLAPLAGQALRKQRLLQQQEQLRAGSAWIDSGYIFTTTVGGAMEPRNVSREYKKLATGAGLCETGMHALRHYAATAWLSTGKATVRDVADALGHSSPTITLDIYTSTIPEAQTAAINAAADALEA